MKDKRVVFIEGELVKDVTTHPVIAVCAQGITDYVLANDPSYHDLFTEVTDDDEIVPFVYVAPRSSGDLIRRRQIIQTASRTSFGVPLASKFTGVDGLNAVTLVGWRIDKKYGTDYSERVENYRWFAHKTDPAMAVCVTDVKGDRSLRPPSSQEGRNGRLRGSASAKAGQLASGKDRIPHHMAVSAMFLREKQTEEEWL